MIISAAQEQALRMNSIKEFIDRTAHFLLWRLSQVNAYPKSWTWLSNGILKKGIEMVICAAQEQDLTMNSIKDSIDRTAHLFLWTLSQVNADLESWRWLRNGILNKGTEMIICAAQEQALKMYSIKDSSFTLVETP